MILFLNPFRFVPIAFSGWMNRRQPSWSAERQRLFRPFLEDLLASDLSPKTIFRVVSVKFCKIV